MGNKAFCYNKDQTNMRISIKVIPALLREYKSVVITLILLSIAVDIFFIKSKSDAIVLGLLGLIIFFFRFYKIENRQIFIICLIPITIIFFLFIVNFESAMIQKAATWLYLLMGAGIIQEIFKAK